MAFQEKLNSTIYVENLKCQKDMHLAIKDLIENQVYKALPKSFYDKNRYVATTKESQALKTALLERLDFKYKEKSVDTNYAYHVDNLTIQRHADDVVFIEFALYDILTDNKVFGMFSVIFDSEKEEYVPSEYQTRYLSKLDYLIEQYTHCIENYETFKKEILSSNEKIDWKKYPRILRGNFFIPEKYVTLYTTIYY